MEVIDERGRLFGTVNVVDALVVLLVFAVLVAGVALVTGDRDAGEPATRSVTATAGPVPPAVAALVTPGDSVDLGEDATVADVYVSSAPGSGVNVTVSIRARGSVDGGAFVVDGSTLRAGRALDLIAAEYELDAKVTGVGEDPALPVRNRSATVATRLPTHAAAAVEPGDAVRVAGDRVATVRSVASYPTADSDARRVEVGVRLRTLALGGGERFAGRPVRVGATLPLHTDRHNLTGTVVDVGDADPPGERAAVTARVVWEPVRPGAADAVRVGDREVSHGTTYAAVTAKEVSPATTVVTSADGEVYARDHPRLRNVTLGVDLTARRTAGGLRFHGRPLETGSAVVLDFGDATVNGTVVSLRT